MPWMMPSIVFCSPSLGCSTSGLKGRVDGSSLRLLICAIVAVRAVLSDKGEFLEGFQGALVTSVRRDVAGRPVGGKALNAVEAIRR